MPQIILKGEEEEVLIREHPNTKEEQEEISYITRRMNEMYDLQSRNWREFNERTLTQYQDDNQKRANSYVEPRSDDIDDWQTRGFEGITREKMFAFVAKVAMKRPEYKFLATNKQGSINKISAEILEDFYKYSWQIEDPTGIEFFFDAWEAAGSGTVIRWEGVGKDDEILEDFNSYDVSTGEITGLTEEVINPEINTKSRRVPLGNFFISNWYEKDIQKQPYIAEVQVMSKEDFRSTYGNYKDAEYVDSEIGLDNWEYDRTFFMNQWKDVPTEMVHVTHWYSKEGGRTKYRIIANGILILATPFPRKDNKYPYTKGIFKLFANSNFFYGKALPDEIANDQDVYNAFKNMVIDRSILHIQRPMITDGSGEIEDDILSPNKILNIKGNITTLDIQPPNASDMAILEYLRGSIERQTSDGRQSGVGGSGVTAREIVIADEHARKLAGVFRLFLEDFDLKGARLRVANIAQFYFEPIKVNRILTDDKIEKMENVYRSIILDKTKLSDGKYGVKIISVHGTKEGLPTRRELDVEELVAKQQGMEVERVAITASFIRGIQLKISIIPESSYEQSRSLKLAMETEYMRTVAMLFPEKLRQYEEVLFAQLNKVYDKDFSEFGTQPQQPQQQPQQQGSTEVQQRLRRNNNVSPKLANSDSPSLINLAGLGL